MKSKFWKPCLILLSIVAFVASSIVLENEIGIPFRTTYRVACAGICLALMTKIASDYPGQRWPWIAILIALLVNGSLFFTPLADNPPSRGEVMFFAVPDATIFLAARALTYPVSDDHQRAVRQQLIVSMVLAMAFSAIILAFAFVPDHAAR